MRDGWTLGRRAEALGAQRGPWRGSVALKADLQGGWNGSRPERRRMEGSEVGDLERGHHIGPADQGKKECTPSTSMSFIQPL